MRPSTTPWLFAASALLVVAGCSANRPDAATAAAAANAPTAATAETTSADLAGATTDETPAPAAASTESPHGPLACRATVPSYGTVELYTKWEGAEGTGVLRRVAPSGMRYEQRVHAERQGSLVIADDPNAKDITAHAAILRSQNGKTFVRLGEGPEGTYACE